MFWIGLILTIVLWVLKIRAALIISILVTTVLALIAGVTKIPSDFAITPSFTTLGQFDLTQVFSVLPLLTAITVIYTIMLTDFFDTMGTATGVAAEAGLAKEDGSVPGIGRVLIVDSVAAIAGGLAGVSSNTTYIESAAGVGDGGRTGLTSIVTGVLFLLAIFLSPIAGIIPSVATAPALILVGYLMFTQVKDIDVSNVEDGIPALLTMILMPLTYDITVGIGAGFISWVLIKVARGKAREVHPLMWVVAILFLVFFLRAGTCRSSSPPPPRGLTLGSSATTSDRRPTAAGPSFGATIRSHVPEDEAGRRAARDLRPPAGLAIGVDRRLRAGRLEGRVGGPGGRRALHGAPDIQGHGGLPVVARDLARRSRGSAGPRTPPPIASPPSTGPASRDARPGPRWPSSGS